MTITVQQLVVEFDLNCCEDASAPMRTSLHRAFLLGVSGGSLMATRIFANCFHDGELDREQFASAMTPLVEELTQRAIALGLKMPS